MQRSRLCLLLLLAFALGLAGWRASQPSVNIGHGVSPSPHPAGDNREFAPALSPSALATASHSPAGTAPKSDLPQDVVLRVPGGISPETLAAIRARGGVLTGFLPELGAYRFSLPPGFSLENLADLVPDAEIAANTVLRLPRPVELPAEISEDAALAGTPWFGRDFYEAVGLGPIAETANLRPVTVAVIDTGIDAGAAGLFDRSKVRRQGGTGGDPVGHGTAMAALIGGELDGAAPGVTLLDYPVLVSEAGTGTAFDVAKALLDAIRQEADLINLSLGAYVDAPILRAAIEAATRKGIVVVAASGNDGVRQVAYPAAYDSVLAVGASQRTGMRADFSNGGEGLDLLAPGAGLQVRLDKTTALELSGTSGAAAVTTGVLAAMLQRDPAMTGPKAAALLIEYADDGGAPGVDLAYGAGHLNLSRVNERSTPGIVDLAIGGVTVSGDGTIQLTIENRGTTQTVGATVKVGTTQNYQFEQLIPPLRANESAGITLPLSLDQVRQLAGGRFEAVLTSPGDTRPANDRVNVRLSPK